MLPPLHHIGRHQYFYLCVLLFFLLTGCAQHRKSIFIDPNDASTQYSTCFHAVHNDLCKGLHRDICKKLDAIDAKMQAKHQYDDGFAEDMGMLNLLEISSLYLSTGNVDKSLEYSRYSECLIEKRENEPEIWELLRKGGNFFGSMAGGGGEFSVYDPVGYERVLLLNIQAMDYLLKGDERAFNVALKSTDWQDLEREKFEKHLETLKKQSADLEKEGNKKGEHIDRKQSKKNRKIKNTVFRRLTKEFSKYNRKALKVPSAFVNPFGDYLAGVAKEYKSVDSDFRSQMDNARIHYENARKLNPKSKVLKLAYKDAKKRRSAKRLVQIVAFDGFAPEKNILRFDIKIKQCPIPIHIELPVYDPVKSKVHHIVVTTTGGRRLARFWPVANIENLALRHQKDMLPVVQAMVAIAAIRDAALQIGSRAVSQAVQKKYGPLAGAVAHTILVKGLNGLDKLLEPDTSSWMSLPKRILAARFHPPNHLKTIVITSYDAKGRRQAREKIKLGRGGRHFIFVRTTDKAMKVISGKKIWSPKGKIKRIDC